MPWIDGGLPVIIDTLLGQVKLGITHSATALNPVCLKRAMFGTIPSLSARSIIGWIAAVIANDHNGSVGPAVSYAVETNLRGASGCHLLPMPISGGLRYQYVREGRQGQWGRPATSRYPTSAQYWCANRRARRLAALRDASA